MIVRGLINRNATVGLFLVGLSLISLTQGQANCSLFECFNNGTVVNKGNTCACKCPPQFTGILCETELYPSHWPDGPYALLMSKDGCPGTANYGWSTGFLHFTTVQKIEIWREFNYTDGERQRIPLSKSRSQLAVPFQGYSFRMNFCFKHPNTSIGNSTFWPILNMTVYGDKAGCPFGFLEENDTMALPPIRSWWSDGYLPYYDIQDNNGSVMLITKHCSLNDSGETTKEVAGGKTFIVVKAYEDRCPHSLEGIDVEEETLQFENPGEHGVQKSFGTTLSFCVYKPLEGPSKIGKYLYPSTWPNGPYALPMLNTGCPESLKHGWEVGYITFRRPNVVLRRTNNECKTFDLFGKVLKGYHPTCFQFFFCVKYANYDHDHEVQWPKGKYGIFSTSKGCPKGFRESTRTVDTAPGVNLFAEVGALPSFNWTHDTQKLSFGYCEKDDEYTGSSPVWTNPYAFLKPINTSCGTISKRTYSALGLFGSYKEFIDVCIYIPLNSPSKACADEDFTCNDGRCIRFAHRCDGDNDCFTGEDEHYCYNNCRADEIFCDDQCLPHRLLCDGVQNCKDGFDEQDYHCKQKCYTYEFKCGSGRCVKKNVICDDVKDCTDGSDEHQDHCDIRCQPGRFLCRDNMNCYLKTFICDQFYDCLDNTDENIGTCPQKCLRGNIYTGRNQLDNRPECVDPEIHGFAVCGLEAFCRNRDRCTRVKTLCDELMPQHSKGNLGISDPDDVTTSCDRALGLTDGSIADSQISASDFLEGHSPQMVRHSQTSWCVGAYASDPYIEVDLGSVAVVVGLVVYNDLEVRGQHVENSYIPEAIPVGCSSFSVQYAIFERRFNRYSNAFFEIDKSLDLQTPQNISFLRPFLARYVRIYPQQTLPDGLLCLRMELQGCLQSGLQPRSINVRKFSETNILITGPYDLSIISSISNKIYRWNINIQDEGFLELHFLTINLHNQTSPLTDECAYDIISFDDMFEPISAKQNSLTPIYPTDKRTLVMTFVVCPREEQGNSSFSVVISKTVIPTIWGNIKDVNILEGKIVPFSLLGLLNLAPSTLVWNLKSHVHGRPLMLSFQNFNIPCETDFTLAILGYIYNDRYLCNSKKRPRKLYKDWILQIQFTYTDSITAYDPEGFSAIFQIEPLSEQHKWLKLNEVHHPGRHVGQFGTYTVHSETLKKTYNFSYQETFEDRQTHAKRCQQQGYRLVTIHNRREMEFLQSWLMYRASELFTSRQARLKDYRQSIDYMTLSPNRIFYIHIGLLRYNGINGLTDIWTDGTSLSYTAWRSGEPSEVEDRRCTGMLVNITTGEGRWESRLCNEVHVRQPKFLFGSLCEKSISNTPSAIEMPPSDLDIRLMTAITRNVRLFQCQSLELISLLGKCDGFPDCVDGSDEFDCSVNGTGNCSEDMFKCKNGECISTGQVCDYAYDCTDKTDEYCAIPPCKDWEFTCENNQCVTASRRCDAVKDCHDGSDEMLCPFCNETSAFSCGDTTCIDIALKCNNIPDCRDGSDEDDCEQKFDNCEDLLRAGYEDNGVFYHNGKYIECQFHEAGKHMIITVYVKGVGEKGPSLKPSGSLYDERTLVAKYYIVYGGDCSVEIISTCPEYQKQSNCSSQVYRYTIKNIGRTVFNGEDVRHQGLCVYNDRIAIRIRRYKETTNRHIKIAPVVCNAAVPLAKFVDVLRCGDGSSKHVSSKRKCLYDIKMTGVIDGCLNYKHLDNCENFTCPDGYIKCPSSFCLAKRYVCDGERQCPTGDDENGCWCDGNSYIVALIHSKSANRGALPYIYKFASQLYSKTALVYIITYDKADQNYTFTVNQTMLHPYNQALYFGQAQTFNAAKYMLYEEIMYKLNQQEGINIINVEQYEWASFKGDFPNSASIERIYHVIIDSRLNEQVQTTANGKETKLLIRGWNVLATAGSALFPTLCKATLTTRCKDQFRCLSSKVCIPLSQICDGIPQCPFEDDEKNCDFHCHNKCACSLYSAQCLGNNFTLLDFSELASTVRILNVSGSLMFTNRILVIPKLFPFLVKFLVRGCGIVSVTEQTFLNAINIKYLDLSFNKLKTITNKMFTGLERLEVLNLEGNYYIESIQPRSFQMFSQLSSLSITRTKLSDIKPGTFWGLNVSTLDISNNQITKLNRGSFNKLSAMEINFEGNEIDIFDDDIFAGIDTLTNIRSPSFKFCCIKPQSLSNANCTPHQDEFSSCEDLMRNPILQTLVWVLGAAAIAANASTIFYRLCYNRSSLAKGFGVFVTNLAASDFLMGVYMIIIAIADLAFRNRYFRMDDYWRNSGWCNLAGVLATVSSEASVLFMCLITLDRILVIKYPFGQWRLGTRVTKITTIVSWAIAWIIALVPIFIEDYFQGQFYATSGVCLALPLTHRRPPGWLYSFLINIGLNFAAFILIAIGQLVIYLEIRKTSKRMKKVRSQRRNDIRIAKNLVLVLSTDFLCWFPIGLMAIMAANGHVIPGETYAWTAVLIVPINAALNPFLYTLSAVMHQKTSSITSNTKDDTTWKDSKIQCNLDADVPALPDAVVAAKPDTHVPSIPDTPVLAILDAVVPAIPDTPVPVISDTPVPTIPDTPVPAILDTPEPTTLDLTTVPIFRSLADIPSDQISFKSKEVLTTYIVIARTMNILHENNFVFGGFSIGNILYDTRSGMIRVCQQVPKGAVSELDKEKDIYDVGRVMEHMLKSTNSSP